MAFIYGMLAAWVFDLVVVALFLRYRGTIKQHVQRFLGIDLVLDEAYHVSDEVGNLRLQQDKVAEHLLGPDET